MRYTATQTHSWGDLYADSPAILYWGEAPQNGRMAEMGLGTRLTPGRVVTHTSINIEHFTLTWVGDKLIVSEGLVGLAWNGLLMATFTLCK